MYYKIGIGFVLPFAVFLLIVLILNEKKKTKQVVYDEMQTAVRGRAYHYATVTGVLAGIITSFLLDWDAFPMDGRLAIMAVSFLMVTVYVVYMVMKGVYFGVSGNWKKGTLLFFIIGLCNLITGILRIAEDGLPEGKLTATNITVIMGVMFMVIVAAVLIQKAREKRSED